MRLRSTRRMAPFLVALLLGLVTLQSSCAPNNGAVTKNGQTGEESVPEQYADWTILYSTGESVVYSRRLGDSESESLFHALGELDYGMLLRSLDEGSVVYETLRDGRIDLVMYSPDGERQRTVCRDIDSPSGIFADGVLYVTRNGARSSSLWTQAPDGQAEERYVGEAVACGVSEDATATTAFTAARSDSTIDPVDQDLYVIRADDTPPRKIASAPRGYGFQSLRASSAGVYYVVAELAGEEHGQVMYWQAGTGQTQELASHASLLDVASDGTLLLSEPAAMTPVASREDDARETARLRLLHPDGTSKVLQGSFEGEPFALFCGESVLVTYHDGTNHVLDVHDADSGKVRTLFKDADVKVSEIEILDGRAVLGVLDRLRSDGLPSESSLVWMSVEDGDRVTLARTDSGFIHLAPARSCTD